MDSNNTIDKVNTINITLNKPNKKRYTFVVITTLVMVLITVGVAVIVGMQINNISDVKTTDNFVLTGTSKDTSVLEFIKADIPDRWTIKEYKDGQRTQYMSDANYGSFADTYKGLGAIEVINPRNELVFSMNMIYGIGGTSYCDPIFKFADTEVSYINNLLEGNKAFTMPAVAKVTDLTNSVYKQYDLFGLKMRYIGTDLYLNSDNSVDTAFNPACDDLMKVHFLKDSKIFFYDQSIEDGVAQSIYIIQSNAHSYDMDGLDQILSSLKSK